MVRYSVKRLQGCVSKQVSNPNNIFAKLFFTLFKSLMNFTEGQTTTLFGPFLIMLRCEMLENGDANQYQWKSWRRTFRTSIQEIKVEFIINRRRITIVAETFVKESWTLIKETLIDNQVSPADGIQCQNCLKQSNCRIDTCNHFICLECAYMFKEIVINACSCGKRMTSTITHFTTDSELKLEESCTERMYQLVELLTFFLIPVTNHFEDTEPVVGLFGPFKVDVRNGPPHNYNLRKRIIARYGFSLRFGYYFVYS